jgi:hypothetical protein
MENYQNTVIIIPSLIDLCIDVIIRKVHTLDNILMIATYIDFNNPSMIKLKEVINKKIQNMFPAFLEHYSKEELIDRLGAELYTSLYDQYNNILQAKKQFSNLKGSIIELTRVEYDENSEYFPLEVLIQGAQWPKKVEVDKRENYLSPEDFHKVFKMTKEQFYKLAKYERIQLKKEKKLF